MTRRTIRVNKSTEKNPLDKAGSIGVRYPKREAVMRQGNIALSKANESEGTYINDDAWEEIATIAQYLCRIYPDPDYYDLFNWMRTQLYGGQEYSTNFISTIDAQVEKELGPWS